MTLFIILAPLMVLAVAIAAVPVLYVSIREHNLIHHGQASKPRKARPVYPLRTVEVPVSGYQEQTPVPA